MEHRVRVKEVKVLSDDWYILKKTIFDFRRRDGSWQTLSRETYDRGNGATILLFNRERKTVLLTRQFRFPAFVNGCRNGMLIETCAGLCGSDFRNLGLVALCTCALLVDQDRSEQNCSTYQILIERVDVEEIHDILSGSEYEYSDDDSGDCGAAALQRHSAEHAGRNHVELKPLCAIWLTTGNPRC